MDVFLVLLDFLTNLITNLYVNTTLYVFLIWRQMNLKFLFFHYSMIIMIYHHQTHIIENGIITISKIWIHLMSLDKQFWHLEEEKSSYPKRA